MKDVLKNKLRRRLRNVLDQGFIDEYVRQVWRFSQLKPQRILEIGALDGTYAALLGEFFKVRDEDIVLVEPNPALIKKLKSFFPKSMIFEAAISSKPGSLTLNQVVSEERDRIGCTSLLQRTDAWSKQLKVNPVTVESMTGATLMSKIAGIVDLCIIDVEGAAYDVIESFGASIDNVKSLMVECEHEAIFKDQKLYPEVARLLESKGFRNMAFRYSYSNQSDSVWIQKQSVNLEIR